MHVFVYIFNAHTRVYGDVNCERSSKICDGRNEPAKFVLQYLLLQKWPGWLSEESDIELSLSASSMAEYERHVQFLQESYSSKRWSLSSMLTLLKETADKHREWIQDHQ